MNRDLCIRLLALVLVSFCLSACRGQKKLPSAYVQREYEEQQARMRLPAASPRMDEQSKDSLVINMEHYRDRDWEKQPYETQEEWVRRIRQLLELNQDAILLAREELNEYIYVEQETVKRIQELSQKNDHIINLMTAPREEGTRAQEESENLDAAPFTIHLIRDNDTLFSISKQYYRSYEKVKDIALWNQGWVRHPDEILSGLAIVLFPESTKDKSSRTVENYIEQLRSPGS